MKTPRAWLGLESLEAREVPAVIGTLDPTFGSGGKTTLDFGITSAQGNAVAVQPDGNIVVVGTDSDGDLTVARFRPNGLPDFNFGPNRSGHFTIDVGGTDVATSVAIQNDGQIVIAGYTDAITKGNNDFLVLRLNANGTALDKTFGFGGYTTIAYDFGGNFDDRVMAMALQGDGRILLAGYDQYAATDYDFALVRLNTDGSLDQAFGPLGGGNFFFFDIGGGLEDKGMAMAVQKNGQIVIAGSTQITNSSYGIGVVRVNPDGYEDQGFGFFGYNAFAFGAGAGTFVDKATSVQIAPDGGVIVGAYAQVNGTSNYDMAVLRLNSKDGQLDPNFGIGGGTTVAFDLGGNLDDRTKGMAIQPDGKIILLGTVNVSDTESDFGVVRLNTDGSLDTTFNQTGKLTIDFGGNDMAGAVALQPNGRIVVVGTSGDIGSFAMARIFGTVERPQSLAVGGEMDSSATVFKPDFAKAQLLQTSSTPSIAGFGTNVRVASGDVNGDGYPDTIVVTGPGVPIRVAVLSGQDNVTVLAGPFDPFGDDFTGGGFVAAGDFNNDGHAEFVVTPDQGGGPRVSIFSLGADGGIILRSNFFGINDPNFRGGARVAVGDVNGDGIPDLAVAAGFQGGPRVALYNGRSAFTSRPSPLVSDFFAFESALRNGVYVSIGDVNGDGFGDLVFGAGPGGSPRVLTVSGQKLLASGAIGAFATPLSNFIANGAVGDRGGIRVATTDVDGDNKADVVVGSGEGSTSMVRVYLGKNYSGSEPKKYQDLDPFFSAVLTDGTFVG
jgi:uncharacterized delta-60 repeat protein